MQGASIESDLLLTGSICNGVVDLTHTRVSGQLDCTNGSFDAGERRNALDPNSPIGDNDDDRFAITARRLHVERGFLFRSVKVRGDVMLHGAHIGDLLDDAQSWANENNKYFLAGFTYNRFGVSANWNAASRRCWLKNGTKGQPHYAQPYTQLARILRQMGHAGEARKVLMERAALQAQATRDSRKIVPNGDVPVAFRSLWADLRNLGHWLIDWTAFRVAGYGHAPQRSLWCLIGLFLIATTLAHFTWEEGSFAPNSDVVLTSPGWAEVTAIDCLPALISPCLANPAQKWSNTFTTSADTPTQGADWDSFNRYGYAADLVVPFLDLGQTDAWAPSKDRGDWGKVLW